MEAVFDQSYTQYQLDRNLIRKIVRKAYLRNVHKHVLGKAVDFGCGVGELLRMLPHGSIGLEINPATVAFCKANELDVRLYEPTIDQYSLSALPEGEFTTLVISHVLEHLDQSEHVLRNVLRASQRLGIKRVIVVVPGRKGYSHDTTHRTFIDEHYLSEHNLWEAAPFRVSHKEHFPFNSSWAGDYLTHNELMIIYDQ